MTTAKIYLAVVLVFLAIDAIWIGVLMKNFYSAELGDLARRDGAALAPRWLPAILVYLLIPLGIVLFVRPAMGPDASLLQAAAWGALYGFISYGVYDLTNRATLDKWSLRVTMIDMAWGATLCAVCAIAMRLTERKLITTGPV